MIGTTQKIKLLKILELLQKETDVDNPLTTNQICSRLNEAGVSCDRRTLSQEIALLNECGYEIMTTRVGRGHAYYVEDRKFSVPELRILIDAVQAASFISEKKTADLIARLASLGGMHRAELLTENVVHFNTRKHNNEAILYNVDALEEAILHNKKVLFKYFDINESRGKVFRRDGHHYIVEPVVLVFHEDNYYLMVYSAKHDSVASYRVDRMENVTVVDEHISSKAIVLRNQAGAFTEQTFKMYGGSIEEITISFDDQLIGPIYDKFGEETNIIRVDDRTCQVKVNVQISPVFWGWIFQFADQMRIIEPQSLKDEYRQRLESASEAMSQI